MSAVWKGYPGVVMISEEPFFDAETGVREFDQTLVGSKAAIYALAYDVEGAGMSYHISNSGPVYSIVVRVPANNPATELLDRYEIVTESDERSLFENPALIADAEIYDSEIDDGEDTYRKVVEDSVEQPRSFVVPNGAATGFADRLLSAVRHLRAGVTGMQVDFIVLRRFRQLDLHYANNAGKISLRAGSFIYTTGQLNLPASVAFTLPATPAAPSADYTWGWKLRGQRVDLVGTMAEQTFELVFAPWSNLLYEASGSNLDW